MSQFPILHGCSGIARLRELVTRAQPNSSIHVEYVKHACYVPPLPAETFWILDHLRWQVEVSS